MCYSVKRQQISHAIKGVKFQFKTRGEDGDSHISDSLNLHSGPESESYRYQSSLSV